MWLEKEKVREIDSVVYKGEPKGLARIFSELFLREERPVYPPLTTCPQCGKKLIGQALPYLEYLVNACPDRHGVWMAPEVSSKFRSFVSEQMVKASRRVAMFRILFLAIGAVLLLSFFSISEKKSDDYPSSEPPASTVSEERNPRPVVITEKTFSAADERMYFSSWFSLLDEGVANLLRMEAALKNERGEELLEATAKYLEKQNEVISGLKSIEVPARLEKFHVSVMEGIHAQMIYMAAIAKRKSKDPRYEDALPQNHPLFKACFNRWMAARENFLQLSIQASPEVLDAVEERMDWMNIL